TNTMGTGGVPISGSGVFVFQADGALIGGAAPGAGNLISGAAVNVAAGIFIRQSTNTHIAGNHIGTAADGPTPLPDLSDRINIADQSSNNAVGSQIAGNIIAFNGLSGIRIDGSTPPVRSNTISGNSIYANDDGGIRLVQNANDNLAPPTIVGSDPLHGTACAPCAVEIFSDSDGQGRVFEAS